MLPEASGSRMDLVRYRLEVAQGDLDDARLLLAHESYRSANNRAYYAIYHAISAVHAMYGKAYKKHKDAIANFNKDYVKAGAFPLTLGRKISNAARIRHASDYDDFYVARKQDVEEQIETAAEVLTAVEEYCNNHEIAAEGRK